MYSRDSKLCWGIDDWSTPESDSDRLGVASAMQTGTCRFAHARDSFADAAAALRSLATCCTAPSPLTPGFDQNARLRGQVHQRPRHEEHHDDIEDGGQAEGEREAAHLADREYVQHRGGDEADRVTGQDRPARTRPAARNRGPETAALTHLVLDSFEEHHERVGGHTDTDDQTGDAGEVEGETDLPAEQHHDP